LAQVWLVTGSSRGLGRAIVEAGLAAGNKVLATARGVESLADLPGRYGDQVKPFALDVTDEAAAADAIRSAIDLFGSLDVVINNAGYGNLSSIEDTPLSEFRAQIETNLFGTIFVKGKQATSFSFHRLAEGSALRDVGLIRRRNGVSKASLKCCRAK
jgi:NAD(P)-dependent dehydrogenase (short-subunit alcohol dehydrogenase family)